MPSAFVFTAYGDAGSQAFVEVDRPVPGPSELLVRVRAAAVNPFDIKLRSGMFGQDRPLPSPFGSEVAGVVEALGTDVAGFAVGDEVFGIVAAGSGGFAEYALTSAEVTARKPPQLPFTAAATLSVAGATAWDGIAHLGLAEGQTVLINGIGGGVGVMAAQLARDFGLAVFGTGAESKRALVESLGATLVRYGEGVADRVRALLPDGVDAILDLVGGEALRAIGGLAKAPVTIVSSVDPAAAGEFGGSFIRRERSAGVLAELAALVADGKLDPHVSDVVPFAEAARAIAAVESGHAQGKVVISLG